MVNKMEYRVECQVLGALHSENRISRRFPIGQTDLIRKWTKEEVQFYHSTHYRPDNVVLYVVGDVDVMETEKLIHSKFGSLKPKLDAETVLRESGEFPSDSMHSVNPHFPPVVHDWSCDEASAQAMTDLPEGLPKQDDSKVLMTPEALAKSVVSSKSDKSFLEPVVYKHELLQSFSFHLFAKRPIEPIVTFEALRRDIMRRMTLSALQIRFNVEQRQDPLFTFVDFNQLNWPREGCAVCSLDLTADPRQWQEAVSVAVREIRRLGLFGLTAGELGRYKGAVLSEADQYFAQAGQMGNEDVLQELMEAESCGHTLMSAEQRLAMTVRAIESITLEDVNEVAASLCEHLSHIRPEDGVRPAAVVACCPLVDRDGQSFDVSDSEITRLITEALSEPLDPLDEIEVPKTLIPPQVLKEKMEAAKPAFVEPAPLQVGASLGPATKVYEDSAADWKMRANKAGIQQLALNNGMRVNIVPIGGEPQRASVRLYVPGGRLMESPNSPGSVMLGSRTIQEGGAFGLTSREEVELFCIDHMVMVDIQATEEALIFDLQSVTTPGPGGMVTGLEAVMQVVHVILTDFLYEEDAFERARQGFHEQYDSVMKGLESKCQDAIALSVTGCDARYATPTHSHIDNLSLDTCREAVRSQLHPASCEVSIAGDCPADVLGDLALKYLGTVMPPEAAAPIAPDASSLGSLDVAPHIRGFDDHLVVHLSDSDLRAVGYLAGPAPNLYGIFADGSTLGERMGSVASIEGGSKEDVRRRHPLFGYVLLSVLHEVVNRRLFSVVREERRLTYDASFQLKGGPSINGGWYLVSVTSNPSQVKVATEACRDALLSLAGPFGILGDSVQAAKRTHLQRFRAEMVGNKFWVENLCGTQLSCMPNKNLGGIVDYESVLSGITVKDVQLLVKVLNFSDDNMTSCLGVSSEQKPIF